MKDYFNYRRRPTSIVAIGNTPLGGDNPIRIQSMATVSTMDTAASVDQAIRMIKAGAEYIRFTAQGEREVHNLRDIRHALTSLGFDAPLVADIHFNPNVADKAALVVEKVRINPGNYIDKARTIESKVKGVDKTHRNEQIPCPNEAYAYELQKIRERFVPFLKICRENNTAIRIGVNHGSLSERIVSRYGDTPEGMVESCMEFLRLCMEEQFDAVVVSIKASNSVMMIRAVRLLVNTMDAEGMHYPLHLGVTEAGDGEDGRIKSAVGIGALLVDGIGDTIRVSLSEEPEAEMPVARKLVDYITTLSNHPPVNTFSPFTIITSPHQPAKRKSRPVAGIGGDHPPVVISIHSGQIVKIDDTISLKEGIMPSDSEVKFINLTYEDLNEEMIHLLITDKSTVVIANSSHTHYIGEMRAFMHLLMAADCDVPVIFHREYDDTDFESIQIKAAVDFGTLFIDGLGDGMMLCHKNESIFDAKILEDCMFSILQAARVRISKTEYITCPGCGRTLFDLQKTIAVVKAATSHLKGLKIGIMGCIVNGPGEMADADYGYVGVGRGLINLYKGNTCIQKNIPEAEAVEKLIALINQSEVMVNL